MTLSSFTIVQHSLRLPRNLIGLLHELSQGASLYSALRHLQALMQQAAQTFISRGVLTVYDQG